MLLEILLPQPSKCITMSGHYWSLGDRSWLKLPYLSHEVPSMKSSAAQQFWRSRQQIGKGKETQDRENISLGSHQICSLSSLDFSLWGES